MKTKIVRDCFLILFAILLIINLTGELKYGFWIVITLSILNIISYTIAEKYDKLSEAKEQKIA